MKIGQRTFIKPFPFFFFFCQGEQFSGGRNIILDRYAPCIWQYDVARKTERNAFALQKYALGVFSGERSPTRRWQTARYRWKRGNWTAAVVLTNDLTLVWTIAFDEIRIISVGACQCKCHTYIQLPLVTLRSTAGHDTNQGTPLFQRRFFARALEIANLPPPFYRSHDSLSARGSPLSRYPAFNTATITTMKKHV